MHETRRFVVRGRVQGVAYRASCRREALRLGLSGSAINRHDGTVEVRVTGPLAAVQALAGWLWLGPVMARVEKVEELPVAEQSTEADSGFVIG